jgi:dsDNA-specific endonuclease/ATPase MutS2
MAYQVGDLVLVTSLGKGTVREVRRRGRYLVEIKGRSLLVDEPQLSALDRRKKPAPAAADTHSAERAITPAHAPASLDLHGMTTDEAVSALDAFLSDAILAAHAEVRVIHGRSGGRVKAVVHARLQALGSVRAFRPTRRIPV